MGRWTGKRLEANQPESPEGAAITTSLSEPVIQDILNAFGNAMKDVD
jgi:hypothetical protein